MSNLTPSERSFLLQPRPKQAAPGVRLFGSVTLNFWGRLEEPEARCGALYSRPALARCTLSELFSARSCWMRVCRSSKLGLLSSSCSISVHSRAEKEIESRRARERQSALASCQYAPQLCTDLSSPPNGSPTPWSMHLAPQVRGPHMPRRSFEMYSMRWRAHRAGHRRHRPQRERHR